MTSYTKSSLISIGLLLTLPMASHGATVVFEDDFDSETLTFNHTNFVNWTVSEGSVDLVGAGFNDILPGNGRYVDLDGTTFNAGILTSTTINLNPGSYTLSFKLGGGARSNINPGNEDTVDVSFGSVYSESFTLAITDPLTAYSRTFTVNSLTSASIVFDHAGGDNFGIFLDDVALTSVPVPAAAWLFSSGILGLIGVSRRKL